VRNSAQKSKKNPLGEVPERSLAECRCFAKRMDFLPLLQESEAVKASIC
jgi:hypothetical protein